MKTLTTEAKTDRLDEVLAFVDGELEAAGCPMKAQMQLDIAVEELFVNIAHYAYVPGEGTAEIGVSVGEIPGTAEIRFTDSGMPFDPTTRADPDVTLSAEERGIGGLGIFLVRKNTDEMRYEYKDGKNVTTIRKKTL